MKFYRYEAIQYASKDIDGEFCPPMFPCPTTTLFTYDLYKETPKGYWISLQGYTNPYKWISKTSVKRFAYPTKEEAMQNFIKRTERRIEILEWQLQSAKYAIANFKNADTLGKE